MDLTTYIWTGRLAARANNFTLEDASTWQRLCRGPYRVVTQHLDEAGHGVVDNMPMRLLMPRSFKTHAGATLYPYGCYPQPCAPGSATRQPVGQFAARLRGFDRGKERGTHIQICTHIPEQSREVPCDPHRRRRADEKVCHGRVVGESKMGCAGVESLR